MNLVEGEMTAGYEMVVHIMTFERKGMEVGTVHRTAVRSWADATRGINVGTLKYVQTIPVSTQTEKAKKSLATKC